MQSTELLLPVAANLPAGYLCQDSKKVRKAPSHRGNHFKINPRNELNDTAGKPEIWGLLIQEVLSSVRQSKLNSNLDELTVLTEPIRHQVGWQCKDTVQSTDPCHVDHQRSGRFLKKSLDGFQGVLNELELLENELLPVFIVCCPALFFSSAGPVSSPVLPSLPVHEIDFRGKPVRAY